MYLIVGLGNPGIKYARTRHNMGFMAIDEIASKLGFSVNKNKFKAKLGEGFFRGEKILLVKPQTYMNLSGEAVRAVADFYDIPCEKIVVIYDDFDLNTGALRIRKKGSAGSHNGMKSVVQHLGSENFPRLRIGIGSKDDDDVINFVIGRIAKDEKAVLQNAVERAAEAVLCMITDGIDKAMNRYNGNN